MALLARTGFRAQGGDGEFQQGTRRGEPLRQHPGRQLQTLPIGFDCFLSGYFGWVSIGIVCRFCPRQAGNPQ